MFEGGEEEEVGVVGEGDVATLIPFTHAKLNNWGWIDGPSIGRCCEEESAATERMGENAGLRTFCSLAAGTGAFRLLYHVEMIGNLLAFTRDSGGGIRRLPRGHGSGSHY